MVIQTADSVRSIDIQVTEWIDRAYPLLFKTLTLFVTSLIVATVGVCLLTAIYSKKHAYIFKDTTPKKLHYSLFIIIPILIMMNTRALSNALDISFFVLTCVVALISLWGLFRYRIYGVIGAIAYFWISAISVGVHLFITALHDKNSINSYTATGKMSVYAVNDYIVTKIIIIGLMLLIFSAFLTAYYVRRRYLFTKLRERIFSEWPLCPNCGKPVVENVPFCICCGGKMGGFQWREPGFKVLDVPKYCKDCGSLLKKNKDCIKCVSEKTFQTVVKRSILKGTKEALISGVKKIFVIILIIVVVFIPIISGNIINPLMSGSASVSNTYVEKFNEFWKNSAVAKNETWINEFMTASDELYDVNARCFYANPHKIPRDNLLFYTLYSDASYKQMAVIEETVTMVRAVDTVNIDELITRFNSSVDEQAEALSVSLAQSKKDAGSLFHVMNLVVDGVRFYISSLNLNVVAVVVLLLGVLSLFLSIEAVNMVKVSTFELFIEKFNKRPLHILPSGQLSYFPITEELRIFQRIRHIIGGVWFYIKRFTRSFMSFSLMILGVIVLLISVFSPRNFIGLVLWIKRSLFYRSDKPKKLDKTLYSSYRRGKRTTTIVAVILVVCIFSVSYFATPFFSPSVSEPSNYLETVGNVLANYSIDLSNWLLEVKSNPGTAFKTDDRENAKTLIDEQLEAADILQGYQNVPDEYTEFHSAIVNLCKDEKGYLSSIREYVANEEIPPQSLMTDFLALRAETYNWLLLEYAKAMQMSAYNYVGEIFD